MISYVIRSRQVRRYSAPLVWLSTDDSVPCAEVANAQRNDGAGIRSTLAVILTESSFSGSLRLLSALDMAHLVVAIFQAFRSFWFYRYGSVFKKRGSSNRASRPTKRRLTLLP